MKKILVFLSLLLLTGSLFAQRQLPLKRAAAGSGQVIKTTRVTTPAAGKVYAPVRGVVTVTFDYTLSTDKRTSAGLYQNNKLLRTLWSGRADAAGPHSITYEWDGLDDLGNEVANGTYTIRVLANAVQYAWQGVIGNTSTNTVGRARHYWTDRMYDACLVNDQVYFVCGYTEAMPTEHKFPLNNANVPTEVFKVNVNDDGFSSRVVCSDGTYVYYAGADPSATNISAVYAFDATNNDAPVLFSSGASYQCADNEGHILGNLYPNVINKLNTFQTLSYSASLAIAYSLSQPNKSVTLTGNSTLSVTGTSSGDAGVVVLTKTAGSETITLTGTSIGTHTYTASAGGKVFLMYKNNAGTIEWRQYSKTADALSQAGPYNLKQPTGLAVQKTGNYLFVARANQNTIHVLNKTTGALVQTLTMTAPRYMVVDASDNLWVISGANTVARYTVNGDGTLSSATLSLSGLVKPLSLSMPPDGSIILVGDSGSSQQYKAFSTSTGAAAWTYGQAGGYTNSPLITDDKFCFLPVKVLNKVADNVDVAFAVILADNSIWFGDMGTQRLVHTNAARTAKTEEIMNVGYNYCAGADVNNGTRVTCNYLEFEVNPSIPLGVGNGSWTAKYNWAANIIPASDDQYYRLKYMVTSPDNGRTYAMQRTVNTLEIVELTATGIRYTGKTFPNLLYALEADMSVTSIENTGLGLSPVRKRRVCTGYDGSGNPLHAAATVEATFPAVTIYDPISNSGNMNRGQVTSTGVIVSMEEAIPDDDISRGIGFHLGGTGVGENDWRWKAAPSTRKAYAGEFPNNGWADNGNGGQNGLKTLTTKDRNVFCNYIGEYWKGGQTNKHNHFWDNGLFVGQFGVTSVEAKLVADRASPAMAGNVNNVTYVDYAGGYMMYHSDESVHGGVHQWKITGLNTIQEFAIPVTKTGPITLPSPDYLDLVAGLPYNDVVTDGQGGWSRTPSTEVDVSNANRWSLKTNKTTYERNKRDILFDFRPTTTGLTATASRSLGTNSNLANWKFTADLAYGLSGENGNNYLEILDATGKVIVRLSRPQVYPTVTFKANNTTIFSGTVQALGPYYAIPRAFSIQRSGSTLVVKFGDYNAVTVSVLDSGADIGNPTTLRLVFASPSDTSGHMLDLGSPQFYNH